MDPVAFGKMGSFAKDCLFPDGAALFAAAVDVTSRAREFVRAICAIRQGRRGLNADAMIMKYAALNGSPPLGKRNTGLRMLIQQVFMFYLAVRHLACPREARPVSPLDDLNVTRADRRVLASTGLLPASLPSLSDRATARCQKLWDSIQGRQVVLWMDNFYKRRFGVNPTCTDKSMNGTVLSILHLPRLGTFTGHPTLKQLCDRIWLNVKLLRSADRELVSFVRSCADESHDWTEIRVPLDIVRTDCLNPKWHPFSLEEEAPGTQAGLIGLLPLIHTVRLHSACQLPLLIDENLHYRLCKFMYAPQFAHLAIRQSLKDVPLCYGVWHAYKAVCMHVHRMFFDCFVYVDAGVLREGTKVPNHVKLSYIERMIATLWIEGTKVLPEILKEIRRIEQSQERFVTRQSHLRHQSVCDTDAAGRVTRAAIEDALSRTTAGRPAPRRLVDLRQLLLLITDYCPAIFSIGAMVRQCNWEGRAYGTGTVARTVLQRCLCVLLHLSPDDSHRIKYVRTVSLALLMWTPWYQACPGAMMAEEMCEAMLSKVTHRLRKYGARSGHDHYWNVFMTTPVAKKPSDKAGGVPLKVRAAVRERLLALVRQSFAFPNVKWSPGKTSVVAGVRQFKMSPPILPLAKNLAHEDLEVELRRALFGLVKKTKVSDDLWSVLISTFPRLSEEERKEAEDSATTVQKSDFLVCAHSKRGRQESQEDGDKSRKARRIAKN